jgi:hypothetical protein
MSSKETSAKLPPYWGDDTLSEFVAASFANTLATFVRRKGEFKLLQRIDKCFVSIIDGISNPSDFLGAVLLIRSHSAYRGAVRLAISGQVPDTFPLLRTCLEYALYALHINRNPGLGETWLRRHDDETSLKAVRNKFANATVIKTLEGVDANLGSSVKALYERTIDFGAHPNEQGVAGSMTMDETPGRKTFGGVQLHGDDLAMVHGLKTTAQIGVGALSIFERIFETRFRLLAIDSELMQMRGFL